MRPRQHSPSQTADGIIAAIGANASLAGYTARKFRSSFRNLAAAANQVSDPFDVLVFKPDGTPAEITNTQSTDRPNGGLGGQSLDRVNFTLNNFPVNSVAFGGASDEQRILRLELSPGGQRHQFLRGGSTDHAPPQRHAGHHDAGRILPVWDKPRLGHECRPLATSPSTASSLTCLSWPCMMFSHLTHNVHADGPRNDANAGSAVQCRASSA